MKMSIVLIVLLLVNTSALFAESISKLLAGVNTWVLVFIETVLVASYYVNSIIKDVRKVSEIDLSNLKLFVIKGKKSA